MTSRRGDFPACMAVLFALIFLVSAVTLVTPSQAHASSCDTAGRKAQLTDDSLIVGQRCHKSSIAEIVGDGLADDQEKSAKATSPTTKVTTLQNACYENLPEPGFENCATQRELICGDQNVAWLQPSTKDTARPEDAPVKGDAFCADGSAAPSAPPQPSRPAVSIDDMGEVIAPEPRILADTDGRGVRNAETNFYSPEAVRHETAVIDGVSVEMRLTPVSFIWDYGDGTAPVTTDVGGNPQDGFDVRTPTSHVYDETGTYEVTLTTVYTGEIRYPGQGWEAVPGTIRRTATPVTADIWTTSTRNVADDCSADASAWGCAGPVEAPNGG